MIIREAHNADAQAVRALVFGVLGSYGLSPDPAGTDRDLEDIEAHYQRRGGWFAVLEDQGCMVGSYGLRRIDARECELRKMYLHAAYRGKGLGRLLLQDALHKAVELGFSAVCLETASVLKEAIALYTKHGFVRCDAGHLSPRCDQAYRKMLNEPDHRPASDRAT